MSDAAFNFQTLNPDVLLDALWETGIRVESGLTALNSYENRVYQFSDDEKRRYVAKFYRPQRWRAEQIAEEHQYALDLLADEVPIAAPLRLKGETLHSHAGFFFAVFPSTGGRQYETDNESDGVGRPLRAAFIRPGVKRCSGIGLPSVWMNICMNPGRCWSTLC